MSEVQHHTGRSVKGRDCKAGVLILYGDLGGKMEETVKVRKPSAEFIEEWNKVCAMFKGVTWVNPGYGGKRLRIGAKKRD